MHYPQIKLAFLDIPSITDVSAGEVSAPSGEGALTSSRGAGQAGSITAPEARGRWRGHVGVGEHAARRRE